ATAYWKGGTDSAWKTNNVSVTNWATASTGSTDLGTLPGATNDVYFTVNDSATPGNYNTTLEQDFSIKSLTFTGTGTGAATNSVTIGSGVGTNTLTLGTGGITVTSGSAAHTITSNVALGAAQSWTNNSTSLFTVSGNINNGANTLTVDGAGNTTLSGVLGNGVGGLIKNGAGTLTLSSANTYTGTTTINAGTLGLTGGAAIIDTGTVSLADAAGATLMLNDSETIGYLSGGGTTGGNVSLGANTLTVGDSGGVNSSFSGVISGVDGGLTKVGSNVLTLEGNNTYTGVTTISAGKVEVGDGTTTGTLGTGNIINNASLVFNRSNSITVANIISGTGALEQAGAGTLTLSGTNTYTGVTTLSSGALNVATIGNGGVAGNLGKASNLKTNLVLDGGTLRYTGTTASTDRGFTVNATAGSEIDVTTAGQTLTIDTTGIVTAGILTIGGAGNTVISSVISGAGGLNKEDAGTLTLSDDNTYTGVTSLWHAGVLSVATMGDGGVAGNLGKASNLAANLVFNGGILQYTGATASTDRAFTIAADKTGTIDVSNAATALTMSGVSAATNGGLTKTGAGTLTFSGANAYTGTTTISAGTLRLTANQASPLFNFTGDAELKLADNVTVTGNVTATDHDGEGTLTFEGDGEVTGTTGAAAACLKAIHVTHMVAGGAGSRYQVDFDANAYAGSLTFEGGSGASLGTVVVFIGDASLGEGGITTEWADHGKVVFKKTATVDGQVGSGNAYLSTVSVHSQTTFNADVYLDYLQLKAIHPAPNPETAPVVVFNADAYIGQTGAPGEDGKNGIEALTDLHGIVTFNANATVNGDIGTVAAALERVDFNGENASVNGNIYAYDTTVGTGTLQVNGDLVLDRALYFSGDGFVKMAAGHNINAAVATAADGTGTVIFEGATTLTGDVGGASGAPKAVNLAGNSNATITGDLHIYDVSLGANALIVNQEFQQKSGGTLNLTINSATTYGTMDVGEHTIIESGNKVYVTVPSGVSIANGTPFTIVAVSGDPKDAIVVPTVTSNTRRYSFSASKDAGGNLILTSAAGSYAAPSGATGNESSVANALNNITNPTGDMENVMDQLGTLGDSAYDQALDTMHPDVSSGAADGSRSLTSQGFSTVSNRLGGARNGGAASSGVSSGDMTDGVGVWMQALGSNIHQGERKGVEGYNGNLFGTTIGADKVLDDHFRAGFAGSYGWARVKSKTGGSPSDDINSFQGTIYGSFDSLDLNKARQGGKKSYEAVRSQVENSWYVDGMAAFTQNNYDSRREIWLGGASKRVAKAEHYGQQYSTNFETGYKFVIGTVLPGRTVPGRALEVTPFVSLGYSYLYMNRYKEDGANALNLTVNGKGFNQLEQTLGTKLAYPIVTKKAGTFIPSVKAAWLYDYIADRFETTASFAGGGPSFDTNGAKPAKNGMLFGTELAFLNKGNVTLTGNWDIELKDQYMSNTYYGTARYDF
ncbi:MAG: autotransporter domain-containing protein, partial [Candidatus Omnitrophota bacterium]